MSSTLRTARRPASTSLSLETLEDRLAMSTISGHTAVAEALYAPGSKVELEEFTTVSKWSTTTITYSYSNLLNGGLKGGLSTTQLKAAVQEALGRWAAVTPLKFQEVADSGPAPSDTAYSAAGNPMLRFGHHGIDGASNVLAHGYFPNTTGLAGDVHFDSAETWTLNPATGIDILEVATHEVGHALGLGHEPMPSAGGKNAIMNPFYGGRFSGLGTSFLLADDINGIRSLYGSGTGSVTPLGTSAVVADFGSSGLWRWNGSWQQLTTADPLEIDVDDNGVVVASFSSGLWRWNGAWQQLTSLIPQQTELTGGGTVFTDLGTSGLWRWNGGWLQLTSSNPIDLEVSDNGSAFAEFSGSGLWRWNGSWLNLTSSISQDFQVDDFGNVFGDYGSGGLWRWNGGWAQLTTADPTRFAVADNGRFYGDFTSGVWTWTTSGAWGQLTTARASELDASADGNLFATFTSGVWRWNSSAGWSQLTTSLAQQASVGVKGDYFGDFGSGGLWRWTSSGWQQLSTWNAFNISARR